MALINKLNAIGDAIRAKTGGTELLTLDDMATEIAAIETGGGDLPEEALVVTGNCKQRFQNNGWNWFVDQYGHQITTKDITTAYQMFSDCSNLIAVPFDINCSDFYVVSCEGLYYNCYNLKSVGRISGKVNSLNNLFYCCNKLTNIPEDITEGITWDYWLQNGGSKSGMFQQCYALRKIPYGLLTIDKNNTAYNKSYFYRGFQNCSALDELKNLPLPYTATTWTSNAFYETFNGCNRLKDVTFALNNGAPYVMNWSNQTITLNVMLGFGSDHTSYNSDFTTANKVTNDATYQALKDTADWWTSSDSYCRYNHDSAVATINSLPDTSAYLAANGGTNTIKFRGKSGSATDGGAINTLTESEIAVAAAKGWTVTLS